MSAELELRQLRAFVAVVDAGGFTKAARALGVSQSTVSESIAALDRAVGAPVFSRGKRLPELTPAGAALLPHARRLLASLHEALGQVAEAVAEARATVSIGTNESISAYVLPPVLAALRAARPATRYQVSTAVCTEIRAGIGAGRYDVGFVLEPAETGGDDEETIVLAEGRLVVFGQPEHPLMRGTVATTALVEQELYLSDAAGSFHGVLRRHFQQDGFAPGRLLSTGSVEGVKRGVAADPRALGVLPAHALVEELAARRFRALALERAFPAILLKALLPRRLPVTPGARDLIDALRGRRLPEHQDIATASAAARPPRTAGRTGRRV